jgi:signal transduction histidine kinase
VLALLNLMRNAIQAGGPAVSLSLTVDASAEGQVEILVDDDGPGVDPAMREQLFVNGSSTRADGTGHGLALAREVIERELDGTIEYEDNAGGGARFRLRLPSVTERS